MNKASALAALLLLASCQVPLRNAAAQTSVHVKSVKTTIEKLDGIDRTYYPIQPGRQVNRVNAPGEHLPDVPDPLAKTTIKITNDYGGMIGQYEERWRYARDRGDEVEVLGACQSACTILLGVVPKPRMCFGPSAVLAFHSARYLNNVPAPTVNQTMFDRYPPEIQGWLVAKGGWEKLPLQGYWTLPAAELYQMGYRRCP